jgi:uncharacterized membrane protein YphA (DoxX/SURF4 family)
MTDFNVYKLRYIYLIPVSILLIAGAMKVIRPEGMLDDFTGFHLKNPAQFITLIGCVELSACLAFLIPITRRIGFLLLTSLIGGIIATEALKGDNLPLFALILQITLWLGYLFEIRGDQNIPFKKLFNSKAN